MNYHQAYRNLEDPDTGHLLFNNPRHGAHLNLYISTIFLLW